MRLPFQRQSTSINTLERQSSAVIPRQKFALVKKARIANLRRERRTRAILKVIAPPSIRPLRRRLHMARARNIAIIFLFIAAIGTLGSYVYINKVWQVKQVQVTGKVDVLRTKTDAIREELTGVNLLTLDSDRFVSELQSDPYVKSAYIKKEYPGKVVLAVEEVEPDTYLYTLNEAVIFGQNGKILRTKKAEENYPITEVERLIYLNEKPFRSQLLKERWLADNLERQQSEFKKYQEGGNEEQRLKRIEDLMTKGKISKPDDYTEAMEFKDFCDNNFTILSLKSLDPSYTQIRSEVVVTVEARWNELKKQVEPRDDKPIIYSLINTEDINDLEQLIANGYFEEMVGAINADMIVKELVISSPVAVKLVAETREGKEVTLLLSTNKSLDKQMLELRTLLVTLKRENKTYKKIDLTGKKLVVS